MSDPNIDPKYQPEKFSRRHHFIPVFYLKGFTGDSGTFYVYDKISKRFLDNQTPDSKYFEKNLNNYKLGDKIRFTTEEPYYTPLDGEAAPVFAKLRRPYFKHEDLSALDRFQIIHFLMTLFWRLPGSNEKALDLMKREGVSNEHIAFYNYDTKLEDQDIPDIRDAFLNDEVNQRLYKLSIPLTGTAMDELYALQEQWFLYLVHAPAYPFVIGDDPFIIRNDNFSFKQQLGELVIPLAKDRLLVLAQKRPVYLDSLLTTTINLAILEQSKRYISCCSKEYLVSLVDNYEKVKSFGLDVCSAKAVFHTLEKQAAFDSYEDYLADVDKRIPGVLRRWQS